MNIKQKQYKNGLRLVFQKTASEVVAVNILMNVGSQNETPLEEGYAHFVEHMIFKGTDKINSKEVMDKLTFLGADYNAYTTRSVTRYTFKCLKANYAECLKIYLELLKNATFDEIELEKERQVVIEEMQKCLDDPEELLYRKVVENYFYGDSFVHDELGDEKIILQAKREDLLEFKKRFYKPENCIISVAGNIDYAELESIIQKEYADSFDYEHNCYKNLSDVKINIKNKYDVIKRKDNQVLICVHINSENVYSKNRSVCDVYSSILAGSQNSRLFKILREDRGLIYSIFALNEYRPSCGETFIIFGTSPKNVKTVLALIRQEIHNLAVNGIDDTELETAKNWKMSCMGFETETQENIAEFNGTSVHFFGNHQEISKRLEDYKNITIKQINTYAKKIEKETKYNVVAVGKNIKKKDLQQF